MVRGGVSPWLEGARGQPPPRTGGVEPEQILEIKATVGSNYDSKIKLHVYTVIPCCTEYCFL